jgi:hypothetical protein
LTMICPLKNIVKRDILRLKCLPHTRSLQNIHATRLLVEISPHAARFTTKHFSATGFTFI